MARLNKVGLDYFPLDTDIELDDKIQLIESEFGLKGFAIIIKLFIKIYADKGYFYEWKEKQRLLFAKSLNENGCLVDDVVKRAVKWGIFDEAVFNNFQVLTSPAIQKRYLEASIRRKNIDFVKEFALININDYKNKINVSINSINVNINSQSKEKEKKKVNKKDSVEDFSPKGDTPKSFKKLSKDDFYNSLKPFVSEYGKELVREFFDYWTEPSANGTLKFQLEKTWDTARRLSTWKRNETKFGTSKPTNEPPKRRRNEF